MTDVKSPEINNGLFIFERDSLCVCTCDYMKVGLQLYLIVLLEECTEYKYTGSCNLRCVRVRSDNERFEMIIQN